MRKSLLVSYSVGLLFVVTISLSQGKPYQKVMYKNSTHIAGEDGQDYTIEDYKKKCNCSKLMEYKETTYSQGPAEVEADVSYTPAKNYKKTVQKTVYAPAPKPAYGAQKKDNADAIKYIEDDDDQGMKYETKAYKKEEKKYTTAKKVYKTPLAYEQEEEYQPDEYKTTKAYAKKAVTYAPKKATYKQKYETATMGYDEEEELPYEEEEAYATTKTYKTAPQYYKPAKKASYKAPYKTTEAPYEEEESYETTKTYRKQEYKTTKPYKKEYKTTTEAYKEPQYEEEKPKYEKKQQYKKQEYKTTTEAYEEPQYEEEKPKYEKKQVYKKPEYKKEEYKTTTEAYEEPTYEKKQEYKKPEYKTTTEKYEEPSYGSYGNMTGAVYEEKKEPVYAEKQLYQTTKGYAEETKAYEAPAAYYQAAYVPPPVITIHQNKTHHTDVVVKIIEKKHQPYYGA